MRTCVGVSCDKGPAGILLLLPLPLLLLLLGLLLLLVLLSQAHFCQLGAPVWAFHGTEGPLACCCCYWYCCCSCCC
jgi:hypothetical protein